MLCRSGESAPAEESGLSMLSVFVSDFARADGSFVQTLDLWRFFDRNG